MSLFFTVPLPPKTEALATESCLVEGNAACGASNTRQLFFPVAFTINVDMFKNIVHSGHDLKQ